MRVYPDWFIEELVDEEDKEKARSGELRNNDYVKHKCVMCGNVTRTRVNHLVSIRTGTRLSTGLCSKCTSSIGRDAANSIASYDKKRQTFSEKRVKVPSWYLDDLAEEEVRVEVSTYGESTKHNDIPVRRKYKCPKGHVYEQLVCNHITLSKGEPRCGCPFCVEHTYRSHAEDLVMSWLDSMGYMVESNVRGYIKAPSGHWMELDVYLPEVKFAIECDGIMYHKEGNLSYSQWQVMMRGKKDYKMQEKWKGYHIFKDNQCAAQGIKLIHVVSEDVTDFPEQTRKYILEELEKWKELTCYEGS